jgi:hypothetical protein
MYTSHDINVIAVGMNVVFDFLAMYFLVSPNQRMRTALGYIYWCIPFMGYVDVVCFYSALFLFMMLAYYYLDEPLKCGLCLMAGIVVYHMIVFIAPVFVIYYLKETPKVVNHQVMNVDGSQGEPYSPPAFSVRAELKMTMATIRDRIRPTATFALGCIAVAAPIVPFIVDDFGGMKYSLYEASASRFQLGDLQNALIVLVLVASLGVLLCRTRGQAQFYVVAFGFVAITLEASLIYFGNPERLPHYFALAIPIGFMLVYLVTYGIYFETRAPRSK